MKIKAILMALNDAIRAAAQCISGKHFSRKSPLTAGSGHPPFHQRRGRLFSEDFTYSGPSRDRFRPEPAPCSNPNRGVPRGL